MATTKRITPTARLVLSVDAPREAWLAERTRGITATDLPAIMGLNKYKTAIDVWRDKVQPGGDTFEPAIGNHEAAFWGIALEDVVASKWAEHKQVSIRRIGIIEHVDQPWQRASIDRLVHGCPAGRCAVEVKTRNGHVGAEWEAGVPLDVEAQVSWQLLVSGLDHVHVIALIGGQRLVEHVVTLNPLDVDRLVEAGRTVWDAVQSGTAPELPNYWWTDDYLDQLHQEREGQVELAIDQVANYEAYEAISTAIKDLESTKAELRTQLVGALGEGDTATWNGRELYTYKASQTRRLNSKALAERHPDVAADDTLYTISTTRTLRTKGSIND